MKSIKLVSIIFLLLVFSFFSCQDGSSNESDDTPKNTSVNIDAGGESGSYKIRELSSTSPVTLTNIENSKLFLIRINSTQNTLTSSRKYSIETLSNSRSVDVTQDDLSVPAQTPVPIESVEEPAAPKRIHPDIFVDRSTVIFPHLNTRAVAEENNYPVNYSVGASKTVYVGLGQDPNYSTETTATLRYISEKAYVWVVDDYFDENPTGAKVSTEHCKKLAETFDSIYDLERNIFGEESNFLEGEDSQEQTIYYPMETSSDTGTKVNLILYDIMSDYTEGSSDGIYGYFNTGDYLIGGTVYNKNEKNPNGSHSNGGKYLNIDSGFVKAYTNVTLATTIHEFQHMIHYGMKESCKSETWYNEMCSMLSEDLFQEMLSLEDNDVGKFRFNHLISSFTTFPYFKWDDSDGKNQMYSYANAYGIGSMLAKKFDGADFIYKLTHTSGTGNADLLLNIVKTYDSSATIDSILKDMALEMITGENYKKTVVSKEHVKDGYNYPMTSFDLLNFKLKTSSGKIYTGPCYSSLQPASSDVEESVTLEPNSLDVAFFDQTKPTTTSLKLNLTGTTDTGIKEYLVVVKN